MILAKITGGPGNQLFQYSFGRFLALKNNTDLYLDLSEFKIKKHRRFLLHKFNIKAKFADENLLKSFLKISYYLPYDLRPTTHKLLPFLFRNIIYEKHFHVDKQMLNIGNNNYLIGFWQSEKYFKNIKDSLEKEITLKSGFSPENKQLFDKIKKTDSISINVRRGDFLHNKQINKRHGVIGLSYFQKAIKFISTKVKKPHFFMFSDDIHWVKNNIRPRFPSTYVGGNFPNKTEEDLVLGASCRHHILTNSTFSWWVGWLKNDKNKIILAPKNWFNELNYNTKDLYPSNWKVIS